MIAYRFGCLKETLMKRRFVCFLAILFFLADLASGQLPDLIPREVFIKPQKLKTNPQLDPDGRRLAYIGFTDKGVPNVFIRTLGKADDIQVTFDERQGIFEYAWAFDNQHILYLQDSDGDENFHLYSVDLNTQVVRDLTPFKGMKAQNLLTGVKRPREVLIGINLRDRRIFDMYRIDLKTGAVTLDTQNPGDVRWWLPDWDLVIRAAVSISPEDSSMELRTRPSPDQPWKPIITWPFGESGVVEGYGSELAIAFTPDGKGLYVQSALRSNTTQLLKVDAETGKELEVIAHDPKSNLWNVMSMTLYDFAQVLFHPETGKVQAVAFNYLIPEWKVLDPGIQKDFEALEKMKLGVIQVLSRTPDDRKWIVQFISDVRLPLYYLYDRDTRVARPLFEGLSAFDKYRFSPLQPVVIKARDGMDIPCYVTLPQGVPPKNLPLILFVHGGPWARDDWGFNQGVQWMANRGYAVLQVNFRGSTGYGKKYLNAGNGQWGVGSMQHDLTDAVKEMVRRGIADPKRVAVMGGSYGGYATLAGITFTPELYACAVDMSGLANLKTSFETFPSFWLPIKKRWIRRVGDVEHDDELNRRISPFFHVDNIRVPLLIAHGQNDPRVKISEPEQIVKAMRAKNIPVTFVVYPDEGHGLGRPENQLDLFGRVEEFLGKNLGARFEPWTKVEGSSAELR